MSEFHDLDRRVAVLERIVQDTATALVDIRADLRLLRTDMREHVFGTIKGWMGRDHFRTRRLAKVATEMSLHILAYNLKRAVAVLSTPVLIAAMRG
jgi:hypothetical protein